VLVNEHKAIRLVAYFEAFKGVLVIVAATGVLTLVHQNLHELAASLIAHTHLNPASKYPLIFLDAANRLQDTRTFLLAAGAAVYSAVRMAEGFGLYYEKAWAEVLAAGSGAIYLPIEIYEWFTQHTWFRAALFAVNALIVTLMLYALWKRRRAIARITNQNP
jgi:uncharacterized membrane protein (DUF2068 family)